MGVGGGAGRVRSVYTIDRPADSLCRRHGVGGVVVTVLHC